MILLPALLREKDAASYLGISESKLRALRKEGRLGFDRKAIDGCLLYDRRDLDAFADSLPYEGEGVPEKNTCDEVWG